MESIYDNLGELDIIEIQSFQAITTSGQYFGIIAGEKVKLGVPMKIGVKLIFHKSINNQHLPNFFCITEIEKFHSEKQVLICLHIYRPSTKSTSTLKF